MSFFDKIFKNKFISSKKEAEPIAEEKDDLSIDEKFVQKFIHKGGKFLYCTDAEETKKNLKQILQENQWNNVVSFHSDLQAILTNIQSAKTENLIQNLPFFTYCESLIAEDGAIMFSSNQLKDKKLKDFSNNFIVLAKTSQIVKDTREGIAGIRNRSEKNSATIISSVKNYLPQENNTDFMSYGNTNSKTLYLLLLEDL